MPENGRKRLRILDDYGRVVWDSEHAASLYRSVSEDLKALVVGMRYRALLRGEGLTVSDAARKVDAALRLPSTSRAKSYLAISEFLAGRPRQGNAPKFVAAFEGWLTTRVSPFFSHPPLTAAAIEGEVNCETLREFVYRVDEISLGYALACSETESIAAYYGAAFSDEVTADQLRAFESKDPVLVERISRAVFSVYCEFASASAWHEGLLDRFYLHQQAVALYRALLKYVRCLMPQASLDAALEMSGQYVFEHFRKLRVAMRGTRGTDPIRGPSHGLYVDPCLAYGLWRAYAFKQRLAESGLTFLELVHSTGLSEHTIQDLKRATPHLEQVYRAVAPALEIKGEEWRSLRLSDEQVRSAAIAHLDHHFPGVASLACDREAVALMFDGTAPSHNLTGDDLERRQAAIRNNPARFRSAELRTQKVWLDAVELARTKLSALGMPGLRPFVYYLSTYIATVYFGAITDTRFAVTPFNEKPLHITASPVDELALALLRDIANVIRNNDEKKN